MAAAIARQGLLPPRSRCWHALSDQYLVSMAATAAPLSRRRPLPIAVPLLDSMRMDARGGSGMWGDVSPSTMHRGNQPLGAKYRPRIDESPFERSRIQQAMPTTADHHTALQSLAERLSLPLALPGTDAKPIQAWKDRSAKLRQGSDRRTQEEMFEISRKFLMASDRFTFGHMLAYQRKLLDLMGANGWRRRLSEADPSILHLEKELRVLEVMTPIELASNHKRVFTKDAIRLIAEKSATSVSFVDQVIMEHDILRADRRWYMILEQFGKPLPKTFEDRQHMGEYDRPFSESEKEYREELMEKRQESMGKTPGKMPRITQLYFRKPTCGGNRWSTRVPRWYPSQWKLRPPRQHRLRGVGPGRGGDRGKPSGHLAKFVTS
eukprot:TRINITY_DN63689_c0_g1_i1.p1 TRINITY_DN63689_c0_g1~~TRINITY_DN63689_c0_g1_i1.p1  ORF type:complete len:379 (+),score=55.62 TRINITY_DN63689_c0_g1_i1:82-1218(+)